MLFNWGCFDKFLFIPMSCKNYCLQIISALILLIALAGVILISYGCFKSENDSPPESENSSNSGDKDSKISDKNSKGAIFLRLLISEKSEYKKFYDEIVMRKFFTDSDIKKIDLEYDEFVDSVEKLPKGDEFFESIRENIFEFKASSENMKQLFVKYEEAIQTIKKKDSGYNFESISNLEFTLKLITEVLDIIFSNDSRIAQALYYSNGKDFLKISDNLANKLKEEMDKSTDKRSLKNIFKCPENFELVVVPENNDMNYEKDIVRKSSDMMALNILNKICEKNVDLFQICGNKRLMREFEYEYIYICYKTKEIILSLYTAATNVSTDILNKERENIANMMYFYSRAVIDFIFLLNKQSLETERLYEYLKGKLGQTDAINMFSAEIRAKVIEMADLIQ